MSAKLERVRKLLAYAEASSGPDAESYRERAIRLMAEHGIDDAMVDAARVRAGEAAAARPTSRTVPIVAPYQRGKADLLVGLAGAMGCRSVYHHRGSRRNVTSVTMTGYPSDIERAELLFTSLLLQVAPEMAREQAHSGAPASATAAARRAYLAGFRWRVVDRVRAAEEAAREQAEQARRAGGGPRTGRSVELVLADRAAQVARVHEENHPGLKPMPAAQVSNGASVAAGIAAGDRADIGGRGSVAASSARPALGSSG